MLDHIFSEYSASLARAATSGGLLKNRIRELIDILWALVSLPQYRVSMAILRNIDRSPQSSISSQQFVETWGREIGTLWDRVFQELIATPERSDTAKRIMFAALRGFADELNPQPGEENQDLHRELDALADSITFLVSQ